MYYKRGQLTSTRYVYLIYMKNKSINIEFSFKRRDMVSQGAYDGRFRIKVVVDKKKQQSKDGAKKWKIDRNY